MSDVPLCPVCNGRGVVECNDEGAAEYGGFVKCPNGCVPVEVWRCALDDIDACLSPCQSEWRHDPTMLRIDNAPPTQPCGFIVRYFDPAVVKKWCEAHNRSAPWSSKYCDGWSNADQAWLPAGFGMHCHLIAVRIEKLGELA